MLGEWLGGVTQSASGGCHGNATPQSGEAMQVYSSYASLWGRKAISFGKGGVNRLSEAVGHYVAPDCGIFRLGHVVR